jgi:hypothetical protein
MHDPNFSLSDRDLKKKEEKELGVGAYITGCLLTKRENYKLASARRLSSLRLLPQFDYYS